MLVRIITSWDNPGKSHRDKIEGISSDFGYIQILKLCIHVSNTKITK